MVSIKKILETKPGDKIILQGNEAFALGVLHAGYHAADGYPGTPSTEVMEHLLQVPELISAQWSVNEAVAVGVGVGHAIAGHDTVVTMKVPGLFQAADVVASAAFSDSFSGALVLFVSTDHAPSSTQYLVDSRHFLSSLYIPVIEPRNHQDLYLSAERAADLSRLYSTPVVILCSSVLSHSEGIITLIKQRKLPASSIKKSRSKVLLPKDARLNFNDAVLRKMPKIKSTIEKNIFIESVAGIQDWGIIACGEASLIVKETLHLYNLEPHQLYIGISNPLLSDTIDSWSKEVRGPVFLIEDGERFVEGVLKQHGLKIIGKEGYETVTHWTPDLILNLLTVHKWAVNTDNKRHFEDRPLNRYPSICPGCPYRAVSMAIQALKRNKKIDLVFGDIGCSTLLHFQKTLDINLCMGASESMRQGFVLSNPQQAHRVISLIGDSSECHSGMDATRNAVYRKIPGVKVILDNSAIAMTGGQKSPTRKNAAGYKSCNLNSVLEAEGVENVKVDAYDYKEILHNLDVALSRAEQGVFSSIVIDGECVQIKKSCEKKNTQLQLDQHMCKKCGICSVCPAIDFSPELFPVINSLCTRCGSGKELCVTSCPTGALTIREKLQKVHSYEIIKGISEKSLPELPEYLDIDLPETLRVLICGVGGQGNLFMGKVLTHVMQLTSYIKKNILKGEVHGMAQKGGSVCSTFACGDVYSPVFASQSVDIMIAMEQNESLRPQYLELLKPDATIILNSFSIRPPGITSDTLLSLEEIVQQLCEFNIIVSDSKQLAPRNANAFILGVVSGILPFSIIPSELWIRVLEKLSTNSEIASDNISAFKTGQFDLIQSGMQR
ncbi:MAG TPA: 2-oxoacid:acceptor oxidoreductase family protein [Chitinispirillaceae bacterium]|nr:2-oxoacid:acceptor oxidoreductase family protein [Chitinispirillaceae bacterium]